VLDSKDEKEEYQNDPHLTNELNQADEHGFIIVEQE
jgi:hypothetical protein